MAKKATTKTQSATTPTNNNNKKRAAPTTNDTASTPAKKAKTTQKSAKKSTTATPTPAIEKPQNKEQIQQFEQKITSSKTNANLLISLIQFAKDETDCKLIVCYLKSISNIFVHYWNNHELQLDFSEHEKNESMLQLIMLDATPSSTLSNDADSNEKEALKKYRQWIQKRYQSFQKVLFDYLFCEEQVIQRLSVDLIMQLIKCEMNSLNILLNDEKEMQKCYAISKYGLLSAFLFALTTTSSFVPVVPVEHFRNEYLIGYNDVKFMVLSALYSVVQQYNSKSVSDSLNTIGSFCTNVLGVIDKLPAPLLNEASSDKMNGGDEEDELALAAMMGGGDDDEEEEEMNYFFKSKKSVEDNDDAVVESSKKHKKQKDNKKPVIQKTMADGLKSTAEFKKIFSKFWLSFLLLPDIPRIIYQIVLMRMDDHIIPNFDNPIVLTDFISSSFNKGGFIALLSVKSLFTLITKYNMSYPNFYEKLYSIIEPEVFNMSYRKTFLELIDMFLRSTHLTTYIVAAFAKKFARLALQVPPFASLYLITMVYNLLKRHTKVRFLVHNSEIAERNRKRLTQKINSAVLQLDSDLYKNDENQGKEPFNIKNLNLKECGAMDSSLWEIESLKSHYDPAVAAFAREFRQNLLENKAEFSLKELISRDYNTKFDTEFNYVPQNQNKRKGNKKNNQQYHDDQEPEDSVPLEFRKKAMLFNKTESAYECFTMTD